MQDLQLKYLNTAQFMHGHSHGFHLKDVAVLHETDSKDLAGLPDIIGNEKYLAAKDYGIHGMTDLEGHKAWALGLGNAIFWHCGGVNERSIGIEQVSYIPALLQAGVFSKAQAYQHWLARGKQLDATAELLAAWHNADRSNHPLRFCNGERPGVTSHWNVSQHHKESEGHTDCWPHHLGGYYPIQIVIAKAQVFAAHGYHF